MLFNGYMWLSGCLIAKDGMVQSLTHGVLETAVLVLVPHTPAVELYGAAISVGSYAHGTTGHSIN